MTRTLRPLALCMAMLSASGWAAPLAPPPDAGADVLLPESDGPSPPAPAQPAPSPTPTSRPAPRAPEGLAAFHELENGLRILIHPQRGVDLVSIELWVQVGWADEGPSSRGAVAILGELLRLRCEAGLLAGPPPLRAAVESLEVEVMADATRVAVEGLPATLEGLVQVLSDTVRAHQVDPERLETARSLARARLRHLRVDGERLAVAALHALAFRVHPYRNRPLTTEDAVDLRSREEIAAFLARRVVPERSRLVVVGAAPEATAARAVLRSMADWPQGARRETPKLVEPKLVQPRRGTVEAPDAVRRIALGFVGPPFRAEDTAAVSVLSSLLDPASGAGPARHLQRELPPGSTISTEFVPARDPSLLTMVLSSADLEPDKALEGVGRILESLRQRGVSEADLELAKRRLANLALARTQRSRDQARALGLAGVLSAPEPPQPLLEKVMALTPTDLQRAARIYLDPQGYALVEVRPRSVAPRPDAQPPAVQVTRTASGLQVASSDRPGRGVATAALRLSLVDVELADGELAALRQALLVAARLRASAWRVEAPLAGAARDSLTFAVTATADELPRALAQVAWGLVQGPLPPPAESPLTMDEARDRAIDRAVSLLLEGSRYGAAAYGPAPTRTRLEQLRRTLLRPGNLTLALTGGAEEGRAREALMRALSDLEASEDSPPAPGGTGDEGRPATQVRAPAPAGDALVVLAARAPSGRDPGRDGAEVLASLLGRGPGSRLGQRLRTVRDLGFEAGARYQPLEGGPGLILAWIGTAPENLELAELVLREEVARLASAPIETEALVAARAAARLARRALQGSSAELAFELVSEVHLAGRPEDPSPLDAVTLQELARTCFAGARVESFGPQLALGASQGR